jgi:hypothetical protein
MIIVQTVELKEQLGHHRVMGFLYAYNAQGYIEVLDFKLRELNP